MFLRTDVIRINLLSPLTYISILILSLSLHFIDICILNLIHNPRLFKFQASVILLTVSAPLIDYWFHVVHPARIWTVGAKSKPEHHIHQVNMQPPNTKDLDCGLMLWGFCSGGREGRPLSRRSMVWSPGPLVWIQIVLGQDGEDKVPVQLHPLLS